MRWIAEYRCLNCSNEWIEVADGTMMITKREVSFGRMLRKWRAPVSALLEVTVKDDVLALTLSGEAQPRHFALKPVVFEVELSSGKREVEVGAREVCKLLQAEVRPAPSPYA